MDAHDFLIGTIVRPSSLTPTSIVSKCGIHLSEDSENEFFVGIGPE